MKELEEIYSAGIDIGTSTTQLIFSRMRLQNTGGFGSIPQIKVVSKEIIYRSEVHFTPLLSRDEIDGKKVNMLIKQEYEKAGMKPSDLTTGAVIITGESSRKKNAKEVVDAISVIAGDFVVATAGADLESLLAGKGAGAAELSKKTGKRVVNLDIGGGTTNICVFQDGEFVDTACLDIGGRLVKVENGEITYIAPKIKWLAEREHIAIKEGSSASVAELKKLTDCMANILAQSILLTEQENTLEMMKTNHLLSMTKAADIVTFSGGVATCFGQNGDVFAYGDIGILLAESIQENAAFAKADIYEAKETMRATVIGAGNYSMNISGSTIAYTEKDFPIKNVPVVRIKLQKEEDIVSIEENIHKALMLYQESNEENVQIALAMEGLRCPSFLQIQEIARRIYKQIELDFAAENKLVIILEQDIGKALGQALNHVIKDKRRIICIDGIRCQSGDYIDLGEPIASGNVIPVVVKTLIFNG